MKAHWVAAKTWDTKATNLLRNLSCQIWTYIKLHALKTSPQQYSKDRVS